MLASNRNSANWKDSQNTGKYMKKKGIGGDSARCMESQENLVNDKDTQNVRRGRKIW